MRILLVGEYSRLHNSLKEGLLTFNYEVAIVATGDNFKKYEVDYDIYPKFLCNYWLPRKIKNLIYSVTTIDLEKLETAIRFYFLLPKFQAYDVVQFINSDALETYPSLSRYFIKKLCLQNNKISLLVCGEETPLVDYLLRKELKYSILTPFFKENDLRKHYRYTFKYITRNYRKTFELLVQNVTAFIASDLDYHIPMTKMSYFSTFIANPINIHTIKFQPLVITDKVVIFLGINNSSAVKKGIIYFEKALEMIREKYPTKVEIIITRSIPYQEYIEAYNKAHILLDQIYGYDQGYNALEAMAKGKVVFTGAEDEFYKHYHLTEKVAINALPKVSYLVNQLSFLIENPEEIVAIGKRARAFIEKEHDYVKIAAKYVETWAK